MIETDHRKHNLLEDFLELSGICKAQRRLIAHAITKLVIDFSTGKARPKWRERFQHENLRNLSAPKFMMLVYADKIENGMLRKWDVRSSDPVLMAVVESYISARLRRKLDYGDASGIKLVSTTCPPNCRRRQSVVVYETPRP